MSARFLLAQISDMHIRAAPMGDGFDPSANLRRALAGIREYGADAIIATGDLVNDERAEEYAALAAILKEAPAPVFLVPGNHDYRPMIREYFADHAYLPRSGGLSYVINDYPVRIVAIDQTVPGAVAGDFTEEQAVWLEAALAQDRRPTLVALHHPPFQTQDLLLDTIGLEHAERFAAVVARNPHVARIVCGHHHRTVFGQVAHAPAIVAPSTAWTFSLALHEGQPVAKRSPELTGWLLHAWSGDAGFSSHFMGL